MAEQPEQDRRVSTSAMVGVGCFSAVGGLFGGGMIGAFIAKIVGSLQGCKPPEGLPACNLGKYWSIGMIAGFILLPLVSIMRLRGRRS